MAKKAKGGPNKSLEIRNYKDAHPTATPKEIAEALNKDGLGVSPQFVSTVLSNAKRKGGKIGKRGRKPGRKPGAAASTSSGVEQLIKAKKMADALGGVEKAQAALNALAQLIGS